MIDFPEVLIDKYELQLILSCLISTSHQKIKWSLPSSVCMFSEYIPCVWLYKLQNANIFMCLTIDRGA